MKVAIRLALVLGAIASAGCASGPSEVLVSAAASLRVPLEEIARVYANAGGDRVALNTASSSALARQIVEGAPVDLFVSADEAQMDVVARAERIVPESRVDLLSNQLAVVAPTSSALTVGELEALASPEVRRIGMGDPDGVPAGVYAKQALDARGLWDRVHSKVVPGRSVEAVLAAAENGHVDVAFVYATDARRSDQVGTLLVIAPDDGPRIVYPAAIVRGGDQSRARRFLDYLRGDEAQAVFARFGFLAAETGRPRPARSREPGSGGAPGLQ